MPTYNWTGFYVGANAGYGWSRPTVDLGQLFVGAPFPLSAGIPATYKGDADGFIGGLQFGYNFQWDRIVAGLEGDFSYSGIEGDATSNGVLNIGAPPVATTVSFDFAQKLRWLATLRARLGYTPSAALLLYLTGGLAVGDVHNSVFMSFTAVGPPSTFAGSSSETRAGWTIGGGAEYHIGGHWSAKLDYLYVDLGTTSVIANPNPVQPTQFVADFANRYHIVRIGLNYALN